ncbi:MAG: hypothetical protein R3F65_32520 [bacterium]
MSEKAYRARVQAERLRAALQGAPDVEIEPLLALTPPPKYAGVPGDLARGAAVLAGLRPTWGAIRAAVAPEVQPRTVGRWLDPGSSGSFMPWGAWVALLRLARAALAAESAEAA